MFDWVGIRTKAALSLCHACLGCVLIRVTELVKSKPLAQSKVLNAPFSCSSQKSPLPLKNTPHIPTTMLHDIILKVLLSMQYFSLH